MTDRARPSPTVCEGLTVTRGGRMILKRLTFRLAEGVGYALVGPNGSGKSTLLHALAGVIPYGGEVNRAGGVALLTTHPGYHRDRTLQDHLRVVRRCRGIDVQRLMMLVDAFDLGSLLERRPRSMSLGQQRAVSLLAPLACVSSLVLLDEPFLALDAARVRALETVIADLLREDRTVVISSHELDPLTRSCSELFAISGGQFTYKGGVAEFVAAGRPRRLTICTDQLSRLAELVAEAWGTSLTCLCDGRVAVDGGSMAEMLEACAREGVTLQGIWEEQPTLDQALSNHFHALEGS